MPFLRVIVFSLGLLLISSMFVSSTLTYDSRNLGDSSFPLYYQQKNWHNPDGIGKFYLGREIAKVMGHTEVLWLERPSREIEEQPLAVIKALGLKPSYIVADIGAGSGYFSFRIAKQLTQGKVLAVDIQPEMLDMINFLAQEEKITNVETILGRQTSPNLQSETIDLALMVDAYHELAYPREMMEEIVKALKPGGRVVLVEYRRENPLIPIKTIHKMYQKQVKREMTSVGLQWLETKEFLPQQHYLVFVKPISQYKND
jgi:SAM-dependent methyltransferase